MQTTSAAERSRRRMVRGAVLVGLTFVVALGSALPAAAQRPPHSDDWRPPPPRDFPGYGGPPPGFELRREPVRRGFVFLNGEYVAPPYALELTETGLLINGREVTAQVPARSYGGRGMGGPPGPPRGGEFDNPWRRWAMDLQHQLDGGSAFLSFAEQPLILLDTSGTYNLLKSMTTVDGRALRRVSLGEQLAPGFDTQIWNDWIEGFVVPEELRGRALATISSYEATEQKSRTEIYASRLVRTLEYPLNVGAMVLVVLAIGHLLGGRPHAGRPAFGRDESPEMIRTLNWSLFFAAALSGLDLVWTIMAASSGQLREINPIGSHLVENPRHLAGFKIALTVAAIGLLWLLRRHKRAQLAAWWICLVLTLVTIRWLAFSSMFLSAA